jgi:hypothetical protein
MEKFQKLDDSLFRDKSINLKEMKKIYGGLLKPTKLSGISIDCSTHTSSSGGGHNNDGCDNSNDTFTIEDPNNPA